MKQTKERSQMCIKDTEREPDLVVEQSSSADNAVKWRLTTAKVVESVVSLYYMAPVYFDTELKYCAQATGFVVDGVRGIILTSRQVVGPGPFMGYAVFNNDEQVEVTAMYRDPVHDFGFLKFEPHNVKHLELKSLPLCPEKARVGEKIRVIGNDSCEKICILAGVISILDRNAPDYGPLSYNDFNTEYIQAAACASFGSTGSPVVNIDGEAVALQAGSYEDEESSTDFFLPLWRVRRALKNIQDGKEITRGTIQVQWILQSFDKCKRLGLTDEAESKIRSLSRPGKNVNGMLVCKVTLPEGPAHEFILEGDCLVSINNKLISSFIEVDDIFDSNIGEEVKIVVQRSGVNIEKTLIVSNLHDITPSRYVEICGSTLNDYSYQMARLYGTAVKGVYVADGVGSFQLGETPFENKSWVIEALDDNPTPNLDAFVDIMKKVPDKAYVTVKCYNIRERNAILYKTIRIDRHLFKSIKMAKRNDQTGFWDYTTLQSKPLSCTDLRPRKAKFIDLATGNENCKKISGSFVLVEARYGIPLDFFYGVVRKLHGIVIDADRGLVLVARYCVAHDLCDINITVAESLVVSASVIFIHPSKYYAVLKYDPQLIDASIITPNFDSVPLKKNEKVLFIGHDENLNLLIEETRVVDDSFSGVNPTFHAPRYKARNVDFVMVDSIQAQKCFSGVLCCADTGNIKAFWSTNDEAYHTAPRSGTCVADIMWELEDMLTKKTKVPNVRIMDAELSSISIAEARNSGVPESFIKELEIAKEYDQILFVRSVAIGFDNKLVSDLKVKDVILRANDKLVFKYREIDEAIKTTPIGDKLKLCVFRDGSITRCEVELYDSIRDDEMFACKKLVTWAGCYLQCPSQAVRQCINYLPSQIYCCSYRLGSPAKLYSFAPRNFVTHINDIKVKTVDDFVTEARKIGEGEHVKLKTVSFNQIPETLTLKLCYHYFNTTVFTKLDNGRWIDDN